MVQLSGRQNSRRHTQVGGWTSPVRSVVAAWILIPLFAPGCAPIAERHIKAWDGSDDAPGMASVLDRPVVKVLAIHGMGQHQPGYSCRLRQTLATRLHLKTTAAEVECAQGTTSPVPNFPKNCALAAESSTRLGGANRGIPYVTVVACDYEFSYHDDSQPRTGILRLYELTWSAITQHLKERFLGDDLPGKYPWPRLPLNERLKTDLIDNRLADPVLYIGGLKPVILGSVTEVLVKLAHDCQNLPEDACASPDRTHNVLVGFSLGSDILFDAVTKLTESKGDREAAAAARLAAPVRAIYMLANQVPLISLGEASSPAGEPGGSLKRFLNIRSAERRRSPRFLGEVDQLWIVAISDPNDLLSYQLTRDFVPPPTPYTNAVMSIARTAYFLPVLGPVANPATAHTGHVDDPDVMRLVVCGSGRLARC